MDRNEIEELIRQLEEPIDWAHFVNDDHAMDCQEFHILAASALRHLLQAQTWRPISEPIRAEELDIFGEIFGICFTEGGSNGLVELYVEDDELWHKKLEFDRHWLRDLEGVVNYAIHSLSEIEERASATPSEQQNEGDE